MTQIYLLGQRQHNTILTEIATTVEIKKINEAEGIDCVSLELDQKRYQPVLDSSAARGKLHDGMKYFPIVISYCISRKIPLIASDWIEFPEFPVIATIETDVNDLRKSVENGDRQYDDFLDAHLDDLLERYDSAFESFNQKRDEYTARMLMEHLREMGRNDTLVHVCGKSHIERLSDRLRGEGRTIIPKTI